MNLFQFNIEESGWFVLACLMLAGVFTYLLYQKRGNWNNTTHFLLFTLRFVAVFLICFLFLSPFFNFIKNNFEKPAIAIVIDNSSSITMEDSSSVPALKKQAASLVKKLKKEGFTTSLHNLKNEIIEDSLFFDGDETNITESLQNIKADYLNQNLAGIILLSDGLHNSGIKPDNIHFKTDVYTIGIGDTSSKKDLAITKLQTNKTAYINNLFPIKASFICKGYSQIETDALLYRNDTLISQQAIQLHKNIIKEITFFATEKKLGSSTYRVDLKAKKDELTTKNNTKTTFIETINNKKKILLYAQAPHPDIRVINSIVNNTEKYELDIYIEGNQNKALSLNKYQLIILHQSSIRTNNSELDLVLKTKVPKLFIVGNQTLIPEFNRNNKTINIQTNTIQKDEVGAFLIKDLELFKLDHEYINDILLGTPPLSVPFGDYTIKGNSQSVLGQKIGSIETQKPLFILNKNGDFKEGVFIGEGLWRWNMFEYANKEEHKLLPSILGKAIQYLASKNDKRQLKAKPEKTNFYTSEPIKIDLFTFNELNERIGNVPVDVAVTSGNGKTNQFQITSSNNKSTFPLNYMPEGRYKYSATATIAKKKHIVYGGFNVMKKQLESLELQADFKRLNKIAANNNGYFADISNLQSIITEIKKRSYAKKIHSHEEYQPLRNSWIYLLMIIALLSTEWAIRKAKGSY